MANLSKIKRQRMLDFLGTIKEGHTDDDSIRAITEIENLLLDKKYGLVWEEHSEHVDDMLMENIPVFEEDVSKKISKDKNAPYNFLIEGDNLQSLYLLEKTHKNMIDVIYIDPPYNRGKKDFIYDDNYIDETDTYRHSKWISFMSERLSMARELLTDDGLMFVSVDDNEVAPIKMILNEIFTEQCFVNMFVWHRNSSAKTEKGKFAINTEYILLYSKNTEHKLNPVYKPLSPKSKKAYKYDDGDGRGKYQTISLQKPKAPGPMTTYDYVDNTGKVWKCPKKGWRMTSDKIKALEKDNRLVLTGKSLRAKNYWNEREDEGKRIDTLWNDLSKNSKATSELNKIFGRENVFENPKPVDLIRRCIEIGKKDAIVLDFFAGSGTTAQAVLESNASDGGHRRFIICTNNEVSEKNQLEYFKKKKYTTAAPKNGTTKYTTWKDDWNKFKTSQKYFNEIESDEYQAMGICRAVTYPRVNTVITGIRGDGTKYSDGFNANLKYYKCGWIQRKPEEHYLSNDLLLHIKEMIELKTGTEIDGIHNVLILNKNDFCKYVLDNENYDEIENLWLNQNIVFNMDEMKRLEFYRPEHILYIPKEFYGQELKEVAE